MPVGSPGPEPEIAWLPSYQLPRLVPPAYRMPWPNPWAGELRAAARWRPDVVHAHSPFVTGLLARNLVRETGAPLVFTHHTRFADYGHYLGPFAGPGSALTDAYLLHTGEPPFEHVVSVVIVNAAHVSNIVPLVTLA